MIVVCCYCRVILARKDGDDLEETHGLGDCCADYAYAEAGLDRWAVLKEGIKLPY